MRKVFAALLSASTMMSFAPLAQSSEDIVRDLSASADRQSSGLCIGTKDECADKASVAPRVGLEVPINFEFDSAELTPQARERLAEFAKALGDNRLRMHDFVIEGHTDALGSARYNLDLSERRANSVAEFLRDSGVESERITAVGRGMERPLADDPADAANRRVEMRIGG